MEAYGRMERRKLIDLLNRCWMTHDGMWFYHCYHELGIEMANRLNKAAIQSLAPIEVQRIKRALGMEAARFETFEEFKDFFIGASELFMPDFMGAVMGFPEKNVMHWEFGSGRCFAFRGMKAIGAIEKYDCGVLYRVGCWIDSLGILFEMRPFPERCLMLLEGRCEGDFLLHLE